MTDAPHASPLPFAFEPRPVDMFFPGERQYAHQTSTCSTCHQPVDYAALTDLDKAEYRISYSCPTCFEQACSMTDKEDS